MRSLLLVSVVSVLSLSACSGSDAPVPIDLSSSSPIETAPAPNSPQGTTVATADTPTYTPTTTPPADPNPSATSSECKNHLAPVTATIKKIKANPQSVSDAEYEDASRRMETALEHCSSAEYMKFLEETYPSR